MRGPILIIILVLGLMVLKVWTDLRIWTKLNHQHQQRKPNELPDRTQQD